MEDVDWWRSRGLVQKPRIESHGLEIRGWKVPTVQGTEDITLGPSDYNLNVASTAGFFQPRISNPWHPSFLPTSCLLLSFLSTFWIFPRAFARSVLQNVLQNILRSVLRNNSYLVHRGQQAVSRCPDGGLNAVGDA